MAVCVPGGLSEPVILCRLVLAISAYVIFRDTSVSRMIFMSRNSDQFLT